MLQHPPFSTLFTAYPDTMTWSASQYLAFEAQRTRPVRDLLAAIPAAEVKRAVDIGCGPGNSTEMLIQRYPQAQVRALDSSPDMLEAARKRLPEVDVARVDIQHWDDADRYDVILANAVLQWLPDHAQLFPALVEKLAPGGSLAVQMPDNLDEPAHVLMREVAKDARWSDRMGSIASWHSQRQSARWYYELLHRSCVTVDVWRTVYHHVLEGPAAVVEWFKGSGLRPYLAPLDEAQRAQFLERYQAAVAQAYPPLADGSVLLPFPRLFIVATR
jgi:trans-aconitate 2-methyltransferase